MNHWLLHIVICLFCCMWVSAHSIHAAEKYLPDKDKKVEALVAKGDKQYEKGFFFQALQFYQEALSIAPSHARAHYQIAECYRHLFEYQQAKKHYQQVTQAEQEQYPLAKYYEGLMNKFLGNYGQAVALFEEFIAFGQKHAFKDSKLFLQMAFSEKEGSFFALDNAMKPRGNFDFNKLSEPVNTSFSDYAASPFLSDSAIVITSTRKKGEESLFNDQYGEFFSNLYLFAKDTTQFWKDMSKQDGFHYINTDFSEGTGAFSRDRRSFIFTGCYKEGYCHLFESTLKQGKWQKPVLLNGEINQPGYDSKQPALSAGGDSLFFASNRPGGYGLSDIWMSVLSSEGVWQAPVNVGKTVNTAQNDLAPFYLSEEGLLFFASNGHIGYGGYDIFAFSYCDKNDGTLINLGEPFNSSKDDLYLSLGQHIGYLTSNRENTDGNFDIYSFNIVADNAELISLAAGQQPQLYADILQFFTREGKIYFQQLPLEKKEKLQQLIEARSFQAAVSTKATLSDALQHYYEMLPMEEKERIERLAQSQKSFILNEEEEAILQEDYFYYKALSPEEKSKVQQLVKTKAFQQIFQESKKLDSGLALLYEQLPLEERKKIDHAIAQRNYALIAAFQESTALTSEDIFLYQSLPTQQKAQISQFIAAKVSQRNIRDNSQLQDALVWAYEELPAEAQESVDRIIQGKKFATKSLGSIAELDNIFERNSISLSDLALSRPDNITIEGKIVNEAEAAAFVRVILLGEQEHDSLAVFTDEDGTFKFENINYHRDQKILLHQKNSFTKLTSYAVSELKIIILQDTILEETFDNIYFDTDQYAISDSSQAILDSLASFHLRYPDVKVEISAYADTVGSISYNRALSRQRALAAYQYLVAKQVDSSAIFIQAKGKEIPSAGKALQYSRRIEFDLKGVSTSYNPTREVLVIAANPNLEKIAQQYQITLQQLREMNPQLKDRPLPFVPIRVVANQKRK